MNKKINDIIGSASGWGAQIRETEKGPMVFETSGTLSIIKNSGIKAKIVDMVIADQLSHEADVPVGPPSLPLVKQQCNKVAEHTFNSVKKGHFPCVIGGDHSVAIGTWSGVTSALNARGNFGLIWFDAHMDGHTPETSPSYAYHGMPVAHLMGYGEPELINIKGEGDIIDPRHLVLIGIRSYEDGEESLMKKLGVKIYYMDEIKKRSFDVCFKEAISYIESQVDYFGLSVDLDGFDPEEAPGVGSPAPNGLTTAEVLPHLGELKNHPKFKGLEVVEFNPDLDRGGKTLKLVQDLLLEILPR